MHIGTIAYRGMPPLDGADIEELSQACSENERWELLITGTPLAIPGVTGALVNPIALF